MDQKLVKLNKYTAILPFQTGKVSDDWIKVLGLISTYTKNYWCLSLMINNTIIKSDRYKLKIYYKKKNSII